MGTSAGLPVLLFVLPKGTARPGHVAKVGGWGIWSRGVEVWGPGLKTKLKLSSTHCAPLPSSWVPGSQAASWIEQRDSVTTNMENHHNPQRENAKSSRQVGSWAVDSGQWQRPGNTSTPFYRSSLPMEQLCEMLKVTKPVSGIT